MSLLSHPIQRVIETLFMIPNKKGEIVPFILNNIQQHFLENKGLRTDVLKFRQGGITSVVMAWFLVECMSHFTRAVMIAHDADATRKLLERGRFLLKMMKGPNPELSRESDYQLAFPKTGATFYIGTAGTKTFGRSDTITHLHCSEYAFWPDPKKLSAGLFQAVPHATGTVVRESTANGYGTYHHKQVLRALKGTSRFRLLFYPWYIFEEYNSRTPLVGELDDVEVNLRRSFKCSDEQLQWRREKLEDLEGDEEVFCQEYPATIEEAFMLSGGTMFPRVQWEPSSEWVRAREWSRDLGGSLLLLSSHLETSSGGGPFGERSMATPNYHYTIGVDCAGGTGNDYSEAQVLCLETGEQVAVFRSNTISPPDFAVTLAKLGVVFNNAFLVPETNAHGISVVACIRKLLPYAGRPDLIYRTRSPFKSGTLDPVKRANAVGFKTTFSTKYFLIGVLQKLLPELTLYDEVTVDQLRGFGESEEGQLGNVEVGHDDAVIALALACEGLLKMRLRYPVMPAPIERAKAPPSTVIDFDDIFSRIRPSHAGWINLLQQREAVHGQSTRH